MSDPTPPPPTAAEPVLGPEALASALAHDLRAPLRAIDGFARQIERAPDGADTAAHAARIRAAAARMERLVEKLVALLRIEQRALRPQPLDLPLLAEWTAAELQDLTPGPALELHLQADVPLTGDETLVRRILAELLANARQFAQPAQPARVELHARRADGAVALDLRDHGIGFEAADAARLFVPFQRLHGYEQGAGDGLGLAIVRAAARRHGGEAWAEAGAGGGACFHVTVRDLAPDPAPADAP